MFHRGWKEVLTTHSAALYYAVRTSLGEHHIDFEGKTVNRNFFGLNSRKAVLGTFGENPAMANQYYIYVNPADQEQALYLVRQVRQKNAD